MAKVTTNLDFNNNSITNVALKPVAGFTSAAAGVEGKLLYDSRLKQIVIHDGVVWHKSSRLPYRGNSTSHDAAILEGVYCLDATVNSNFVFADNLDVSPGDRFVMHIEGLAAGDTFTFTASNDPASTRRLNGLFDFVVAKNGVYSFVVGSSINWYSEPFTRDAVEQYASLSNFPTAITEADPYKRSEQVVYIARDTMTAYGYNAATGAYASISGNEGGLQFKGVTNVPAGEGIYTVDGMGNNFILPPATGSGDRYVMGVKAVPPPTPAFYATLGAMDDQTYSGTVTIPPNQTVVIETNLQFPVAGYFAGAEYYTSGTSGMPPWSAEMALIDVTAGNVELGRWDMEENELDLSDTTNILLDPTKMYAISVTSNSNSFSMQTNTSDILGNGTGTTDEVSINLFYETVAHPGGYDVNLTSGDTMTDGATEFTVSADTVITFVDAEAGKWSAGSGKDGAVGAAGSEGDRGPRGYAGDDGPRGYRGYTGAGDLVRVADFAALPSSGNEDDIYNTLDDAKLFRWDNSPGEYVELSPGAVATGGHVWKKATNLNSWAAVLPSTPVPAIIGDKSTFGPTEELSTQSYEFDRVTVFGVNTLNYGDDSTAVGSAARAASNGTSLGADARAEYVNTVAVGSGTRAYSNGAIAIGMGCSSGGADGIVIGHNSTATGLYAVSVGVQARANSSDSVAIGKNAFVPSSCNMSISIGKNATVDNQTSIALGGNTNTYEQLSIVVGYNSSAKRSVTIGAYAKSLRNDSADKGGISIGENSGNGITGDNNVIIGSFTSGDLGTTATNMLAVANIVEYTDDAAALAAGLTAGICVYHTGGSLRVAGFAGGSSATVIEYVADVSALPGTGDEQRVYYTANGRTYSWNATTSTYTVRDNGLVFHGNSVVSTLGKSGVYGLPVSGAHTLTIPAGAIGDRYVVTTDGVNEVDTYTTTPMGNTGAPNNGIAFTIGAVAVILDDIHPANSGIVTTFNDPFAPSSSFITGGYTVLHDMTTDTELFRVEMTGATTNAITGSPYIDSTHVYEFRVDGTSATGSGGSLAANTSTHTWGNSTGLTPLVTFDIDVVTGTTGGLTIESTQPINGSASDAYTGVDAVLTMIRTAGGWNVDGLPKSANIVSYASNSEFPVTPLPEMTGEPRLYVDESTNDTYRHHNGDYVRVGYSALSRGVTPPTTTHTLPITPTMIVDNGDGFLLGDGSVNLYSYNAVNGKFDTTPVYTHGSVIDSTFKLVNLGNLPIIYSDTDFYAVDGSGLTIDLTTSDHLLESTLTQTTTHIFFSAKKVSTNLSELCSVDKATFTLTVIPTPHTLHDGVMATDDNHLCCNLLIGTDFAIHTFQIDTATWTNHGLTINKIYSVTNNYAANDNTDRGLVMYDMLEVSFSHHWCISNQWRMATHQPPLVSGDYNITIGGHAYGILNRHAVVNLNESTNKLVLVDIEKRHPDIAIGTSNIVSILHSEKKIGAVRDDILTIHDLSLYQTDRRELIEIPSSVMAILPPERGVAYRYEAPVASDTIYRSGGTDSNYAFPQAADLSAATGANCTYGPVIDPSTLTLTYDNVTSYGADAEVTGQNSVVVGNQAVAAEGSVAIGVNADGDSGIDVVSVGKDSRATNTNSVAVGTGSLSRGVNSICMGKGSYTVSIEGIAIGRDTFVSGKSVAIGGGARCPAANSVVIGAMADCGNALSETVCIGYFSKTWAQRSVMIGSESYTAMPFDIGIGNAVKCSDGICIGYGSETKGVVGNSSISIGVMAGKDVTGAGNIIVGNGFDNLPTTTTNQLIIGNIVEYANETDAATAGLVDGASIYSTNGALRVKGSNPTTVHDQTASSTTWVFAHDLGYYPAVIVMDGTGIELAPTTVQHDSVNQVTVTLGTTNTGKIVCR